MAGGDSLRQRRVVFLGPPNSGKGTQAVTLAAALEIPAISTGEMLRASVAAATSLGLRVEGVMKRGELVDDELMAEVVKERLSQTDAQEGFLLDGYPRTASQAETLAGILAEKKVELDDVVLIDAPEEVLIARAMGRGREDDQEAVVLERLRVYSEKTAPLVSFYEQMGLLRRIDGNRSVETVQASVLECLRA